MNSQAVEKEKHLKASQKFSFTRNLLLTHCRRQQHCLVNENLVWIKTAFYGLFWHENEALHSSFREMHAYRSITIDWKALNLAQSTMSWDLGHLSKIISHIIDIHNKQATYFEVNAHWEVHRLANINDKRRPGDHKWCLGAKHIVLFVARKFDI